VLRALDSQRFRDLVLDLIGWVEFGDWRESKRAAKPIEDFAEDRLDRRWKKVKKTGRQLAGLDEEPRHRLRIDIKKLRYALEFLSALYEERSRERKSFLAAMADIQEELGFLNDLATARAMLGAIPGVNSSLIPQADAEEEPRHIAAAQRAYEELTVIGPFWR
jgi:CHAD domain-containing protein